MNSDKPFSCPRPSPRLSLPELKALLKTPLQKEVFFCQGLPSGIPRGAVTALEGYGKLEWILQFLEQHPKLPVAWIESQLTAYPLAIAQRGTELDRILFVDSQKNQTHWAALQVIRSQLFPVVILYTQTIDSDQLRQIQIESERSQTATLLLLPLYHQVRQFHLWPVQLHLRVRKEPAAVEVIRKKFFSPEDFENESTMLPEQRQLVE